MTDLVVVSLEAWDRVWRRNQHLIAGLMARDPALRVLFVEPAVDPMHAALSGHRPKFGRGLRPGPQLPGVRENSLFLYQPTKLLPRRVDPRVDVRWTHAIVRASSRLGFADPVLWVNDPTGAAVLGQTGWRALYDVTDDWTLAPRTDAEHARLLRDEAILLAVCAEVVVCSPALVRSKGGTRPVSLIPNGVDVAAYQVPHARPLDLPEGATAVYVGTVHTDRIDVDLCVDTAQELNGRGHLVLVGPAPLAGPDRQRLDEAGVVLLGPKNHENVPAYLQHADVLVVPHVVTPFTESLDPIKAYEYAAVGRPVVTTPVAGFRDTDNPRIVVVDRCGFAAAVRRSVTCGPTTSGSELAASTLAIDWTVRVTEMAAVLDRVTGP